MNKRRELAERETIYETQIRHRLPFPGTDEEVVESVSIELIRWMTKTQTIFVVSILRYNNRCEEGERERFLLVDGQHYMSQYKAIETATDIARTEEAKLMDLEWAVDYDKEQ
ncbi:MAG: hypothetical protein KDD89_03560 [Anaerolineales bacterium]|nr:hypothetical protein [Anaerolineales bacterium]